MKALVDDRVQLKDLLGFDLSEQVLYEIEYAIEHQLEDNLLIEVVSNIASILRGAIYDNQ